MAALEGEGAAEKHQLVAMHQSRVLVAINKRKKSALDAYKKTLSAPQPDVNVLFPSLTVCFTLTLLRHGCLMSLTGTEGRKGPTEAS